MEEVKQRVKLVSVPKFEEYLDIYLDDDWYGSRRGEDNCYAHVHFMLNCDEIQEKQKLEKEQAKKEAKEAKDSRVQKELSETSDEDYNKVKEDLLKIIEDNPDKEASARKNPNAQNWFVGAILKTDKVKPVLVKKVIEDYFKLMDR